MLKNSSQWNVVDKELQVTEAFLLNVQCELQLICLFIREELKEQLEKKKKGSRALADFEDKMNDVRLCHVV